MYSLCHFYKNDFLVCAQQGFSVAENYVRQYPPMSKFHKGKKAKKMCPASTFSLPSENDLGKAGNYSGRASGK